MSNKAKRIFLSVLFFFSVTIATVGCDSDCIGKATTCLYHEVTGK